MAIKRGFGKTVVIPPKRLYRTSLLESGMKLKNKRTGFLIIGPYPKDNFREFLVEALEQVEISLGGSKPTDRITIEDSEEEEAINKNQPGNDMEIEQGTEDN